MVFYEVFKQYLLHLLKLKVTGLEGFHYVGTRYFKGILFSIARVSSIKIIVRM